MSKKLFKINLIGSEKGSKIYSAYAIEHASDGALLKFQNKLEEMDIGFNIDRELKYITLIAEEAELPRCGVHLYE